MKIKPILTEKSMKDAAAGKYTFWVDPNMGKFEVKSFVENAFSVHVTSVRTVKTGSELRKSYTRHNRVLPATKKAIVTLAEKEKIDLFEESKEK